MAALRRGVFWRVATPPASPSLSPRQGKDASVTPASASRRSASASASSSRASPAARGGGPQATYENPWPVDAPASFRDEFGPMLEALSKDRQVRLPLAPQDWATLADQLSQMVRRRHDMQRALDAEARQRLAYLDNRPREGERGAHGSSSTSPSSPLMEDRLARECAAFREERRDFEARLAALDRASSSRAPATPPLSLGSPMSPTANTMRGEPDLQMENTDLRRRLRGLEMQVQGAAEQLNLEETRHERRLKQEEEITAQSRAERDDALRQLRRLSAQELPDGPVAETAAEARAGLRALKNENAKLQQRLARQNEESQAFGAELRREHALEQNSRRQADSDDRPSSEAFSALQLAHDQELERSLRALEDNFKLRQRMALQEENSRAALAEQRSELSVLREERCASLGGPSALRGLADEIYAMRALRKEDSNPAQQPSPSVRCLPNDDEDHKRSLRALALQEDHERSLRALKEEHDLRLRTLQEENSQLAHRLALQEEDRQAALTGECSQDQLSGVKGELADVQKRFANAQQENRQLADENGRLRDQWQKDKASMQDDINAARSDIQDLETKRKKVSKDGAAMPDQRTQRVRFGSSVDVVEEHPLPASGSQERTQDDRRTERSLLALKEENAKLAQELECSSRVLKEDNARLAQRLAFQEEESRKALAEQRSELDALREAAAAAVGSHEAVRALPGKPRRRLKSGTAETLKLAYFSAGQRLLGQESQAARLAADQAPPVEEPRTPEQQTAEGLDHRDALSALREDNATLEQRLVLQEEESQTALAELRAEHALEVSELRQAAQLAERHNAPLEKPYTLEQPRGEGIDRSDAFLALREDNATLAQRLAFQEEESQTGLAELRAEYELELSALRQQSNYANAMLEDAEQLGLTIAEAKQAEWEWRPKFQERPLTPLVQAHGEERTSPASDRTLLNDDDAEMARRLALQAEESAIAELVQAEHALKSDVLRVALEVDRQSKAKEHPSAASPSQDLALDNSFTEQSLVALKEENAKLAQELECVSRVLKEENVKLAQRLALEEEMSRRALAELRQEHAVELRACRNARVAAGKGPAPGGRFGEEGHATLARGLTLQEDESQPALADVRQAHALELGKHHQEAESSLRELKEDYAKLERRLALQAEEGQTALADLRQAHALELGALRQELDRRDASGAYLGEDNEVVAVIRPDCRSLAWPDGSELPITVGHVIRIGSGTGAAGASACVGMIADGAIRWSDGDTWRRQARPEAVGDLPEAEQKGRAIGSHGTAVRKAAQERDARRALGRELGALEQRLVAPMLAVAAASRALPGEVRTPLAPSEGSSSVTPSEGDPRAKPERPRRGPPPEDNVTTRQAQDAYRRGGVASSDELFLTNSQDAEPKAEAGQPHAAEAALEEAQREIKALRTALAAATGRERERADRAHVRHTVNQRQLEFAVQEHNCPVCGATLDAIRLGMGRPVRGSDGVDTATKEYRAAIAEARTSPDQQCIQLIQAIEYPADQEQADGN